MFTFFAGLPALVKARAEKENGSDAVTTLGEAATPQAHLLPSLFLDRTIRVMMTRKLPMRMMTRATHGSPSKKEQLLPVIPRR